LAAARHLTRALARRLPAQVAITATDLNPAMLDRAKSHPGLEGVRWRRRTRHCRSMIGNSITCQPVRRHVLPISAPRFVKRGALRPGGQFLFSGGDRG
jgi:hypothetical protein